MPSPIDEQICKRYCDRFYFHNRGYHHDSHNCDYEGTEFCYLKMMKNNESEKEEDKRE